MKQCVLVLGMHRSGTSVLSGLIANLGYDVGSELMKPTKDNPKGYFENNHVYQLNKRILKEQSADWDSVGFDCAQIDEDAFHGYVNDAEKVIRLEFQYIERFVLKDPRICLLFPIWGKAFEKLNIELKIILAIRSPLDVARSLQKRNSFSIEKGVSLWAWHLLLAEKFSRSYPRLEVFYQDDYRRLEDLLVRIGDFLDISVSDEQKKQCADLYTQELGHYHSHLDALSGFPNEINQLLRLLSERDFDSAEWDKIKEDYTRFVTFFQKPLSSSLMLLENEKNALDRKYEKRCLEYSDLEQAHNKLKRAHAQLVSLFEKQKRDYGQLEQGYKQRQQDYEQLGRDFKKQQEECGHLERIHKKQQRDYEQLEQGYKQRQQDHEQLRQDCKKQKEEYGHLEHTCKKQQEEYKHLELIYEKQQQDYAQLNQSYKKEQQSNGSLLLELQAIKSELSDLKAHQTHVVQEHAKQLQAFETKCLQLSEDKQLLEALIKKRQAKIKEVEGLYHKVYASRVEISADLKAHRKMLSQYKNRFKQLENILGDVFSKRKIFAARSLDSKALESRYEKRWYWPLVRQPLATSRKKLIAQSGLFSPVFYLTSYPDVWRSGMEPLEHFYKYGWKEGRRPSEDFDLQAYLQTYPDVAAGNMNPLLHYLIHGKAEGRSPKPVVKHREADKSVSQTQQSAPATKAMVNVNATNKQELVVSRDWAQRIPVIQWLEEQGDLPLVATAVVSDKLVHYWRDLGKTDAVIQDSIQQPLVSIVMPTWNREQVIRQAIDSVLKQTYSHWELIITDDGSTDNTLGIIKENYATQLQQKRIKLLENSHGGVCAARNAGLEVAQGELLAFLDSDNQWALDYLSLMVLAFVECDELNCAYSALHSHDYNKKENFLRARPYQRKQLLQSNFIDLNVFMCRTFLYRLHGGFDLSLKRLVDWELILRYTRHNEPAYIPFVGADYYLDDKRLNNITTTVAIDENREKVYRLHQGERFNYALDHLRLAYVLWDFPALSQTFVMNELRWLVQKGYDVKVYYSIDPDRKVALDFTVDVYRVSSCDELIEYLREHQRNYCHSHFAYPAVTRLTWPACQVLGIPFSFMPHAVDIFHHDNQKRNRIDEISRDPLCHRIFVHGDYHKSFLLERGVDAEKIVYNFQAVNLEDFMASADPGADEIKAITDGEEKKRWSGIFFSRFVEKKGFHVLLDAMAYLDPEQLEILVYGYGPLEAEYRSALAEKGFSHLKMMGAVDDKLRVRQIYESSDFLVVPSVEAANGDRDGFPTVILEAFSMGVPVVTTDIAAIPDYIDDGVQALLAPAGDAKALANKIQQLVSMPASAQVRMKQHARRMLQERIGTEKSMQRLTDVWLDQRLDIFLVTYNTEKYDDEAETLEIIRRIFAYTTTPFVLTIVDNGSDDKFWANIIRYLDGRSNVRLVRKQQNLLCGPGSNIALETGEGEFAIYICSKEGFVAKKGWERPLVEAMRAHPKAALGGHRVHLPKHTLGREYRNYPDFGKFRNPDFVGGHEDEVFTHIQGGAFIVRRSVVLEHGGFNPLTPHGGMDIELSYYYESLGYELLDIPEVVSLTVKTRPKVSAVVDEHVSVVHPLTCESVQTRLDNIVAKRVKACNLCEWQGEEFLDGGICPECGSAADSRLVYRYLATNPLIYRGKSCVMLHEDESLWGVLAPLFQLDVVNDAQMIQAVFESGLESPVACIICCVDRLSVKLSNIGLDQDEAIKRLKSNLQPAEGVLLVLESGSVPNNKSQIQSSVALGDEQWSLSVYGMDR